MTTILQVDVAVLVVLPEESVTCAVKEDVPAWLGVPVITPVAGFKVNPAGKFPDVMENV